MRLKSPWALIKRTKSSVHGGKKAGTSKPASLESRLLNLPVEVILAILRFLNHRDRVLLSLTCIDLREIIRSFPASDQQETRTRYIEYLFCVARDLPGRWVCEKCLSLCSLIFNDPTQHQSEREVDCFVLHHWALHGPFVHSSRYAAHRDVQLEIDRVKEPSGEYWYNLKAATVAHREVLRVAVPKGSRPSLPHRRHTVRPKTVNGRLLTLSTLTFPPKRKYAINMDSLRGVAICKHEACRAYDKMQANLPTALTQALEIALRSPELAVTGFCTQCPADFEVRWERGSLVISAWYDFGSDECVDRSSYGQVLQCRRFDLEHAKMSFGGVVRTRYETAEGLRPVTGKVKTRVVIVAYADTSASEAKLCCF